MAKHNQIQGGKAPRPPPRLHGLTFLIRIMGVHSLRLRRGMGSLKEKVDQCLLLTILPHGIIKMKLLCGRMIVIVFSWFGEAPGQASVKRTMGPICKSK